MDYGLIDKDTMFNKTFFLADMNAFFISCEERIDNSLRERNAAVAGDPKSRTGIILTANYNARRYGVRTAMTVLEAKRLCPDLVLVKPDHKLYEEVSDRIMKILNEFSHRIDKNSIDEAWLDMTNADKFYSMDFISIAKVIQKTIYKKEQIPCSIGISYNKFLSKMAAEIKKPNGIIYIDKDNMKEVIWPLKIGEMHGCGKVISKKLIDLNILTIGDLATTDPIYLRKKVGSYAEMLQYNANGIESSLHDKKESYERKSISRETTLTKDIEETSEILTALKPLIDDVSKQIRAKNCFFSTIYLIMKYNDFTKISRQKKVEVSDDRDLIMKTVLSLLEKNRPVKPVRLVGVGVTDLTENKSIQLDLFSSDLERTTKIYKVIDEKNKKYGSKVIKRGFYKKDK